VTGDREGTHPAHRMLLRRDFPTSRPGPTRSPARNCRPRISTSRVSTRGRIGRAIPAARSLRSQSPVAWDSNAAAAGPHHLRARHRLSRLRAPVRRPRGLLLKFGPPRSQGYHQDRFDHAEFVVTTRVMCTDLGALSRIETALEQGSEQRRLHIRPIQARCSEEPPQVRCGQI